MPECMKTLLMLTRSIRLTPNVVDHPQPIAKMTYREMRELSYAGFSVFHDEALIPQSKEISQLMSKILMIQKSQEH